MKGKCEKMLNKKIKIEIRKAIKDGNLLMTKRLLSCNEDLLHVETPFGSWLHMASRRGHLDIVKYLVEQGVNINNIGGVGECNSLKESAIGGHLEILKYLIEKGGKLDISTAVRNPIFGAIYNGHLEVVKYLVEQGLDISVRYKDAPLENMNAYDYADQFGQLEIAKYLKTVMKQKNI